MRNLNLKIQILLLFIGFKYELNNKINNKIKKRITKGNKNGENLVKYRTSKIK